MNSKWSCCALAVLTSILTSALGLAEEKQPNMVSGKPDVAVIQVLDTRMPVVFQSELLEPLKRAIIADIEYVAAFAQAKKIAAAPKDATATYRGTTYPIGEQVVLEFPSVGAEFFQPPVKALSLIVLNGQKTVFIDAKTTTRYEEALQILMENPNRRAQLLEFLRAVRNVDLLLKMTPEQKRKMLPAAGDRFTVALFDENAEGLRRDSFYDPPLLTFRKSMDGVVGARMICMRGTDKKMYIQEIVYYEGAWAFGQ